MYLMTAEVNTICYKY